MLYSDFYEFDLVDRLDSILIGTMLSVLLIGIFPHYFACFTLQNKSHILCI